MSAPAATPGPWQVGTANGSASNHAILADEMIIGRASAFGHPVGIGWHENSEANARLMAAAPEMLAELTESLRVVEAQMRLCDGLDLSALGAWADRLRAVIAKARGLPPYRGARASVPATAAAAAVVPDPAAAFLAAVDGAVGLFDCTSGAPSRADLVRAGLAAALRAMADGLERPAAPRPTAN